MSRWRTTFLGISGAMLVFVLGMTAEQWRHNITPHFEWQLFQQARADAAQEAYAASFALIEDTCAQEASCILGPVIIYNDACTPTRLRDVTVVMAPGGTAAGIAIYSDVLARAGE